MDQKHRFLRKREGAGELASRLHSGLAKHTLGMRQLVAESSWKFPPALDRRSSMTTRNARPGNTRPSPPASASPARAPLASASPARAPLASASPARAPLASASPACNHGAVWWHRVALIERGVGPVLAH